MMPASRSSFSTRSRTPAWRRRGGDSPAATVRTTEQPVLVQQPDPLHHLLHRRPVALERALEAELHQVEPDLARVELDRDQVGLLGDPHGRPRVAAAQLHDPLERGLAHRAVVRGEALGQPAAPLLGRDRAQRVEAAEAAEGPPRRARTGRASRARCCPRTGSSPRSSAGRPPASGSSRHPGRRRAGAPRPPPGTRRRRASACARRRAPRARAARAPGRAPAPGPGPRCPGRERRSRPPPPARPTMRMSICAGPPTARRGPRSRARRSTRWTPERFAITAAASASASSAASETRNRSSFAM